LFTNPLFLLATCFAVKPSPVAPELPIDGGRSVEVWISPDPMRQFASPYAYSPNPINSVDPDGNYFSDASSCADGASNLIDYRQGSIGGPSNLAFDRGFERLYNNASALSSTQQIAAWTAESGLEAGFRFDGPMRYSIYTNGEEGGIDSRVAEGPIGAAFMHSHPSWGGLGLSGMDGDLYFAQIHPEYAIHSGTGRVFYSDRKLANLGLSVELPRLSVPSSSAPGFQPQVKSPR